jgi:hypothetical protein
MTFVYPFLYHISSFYFLHTALTTVTATPVFHPTSPSSVSLFIFFRVFPCSLSSPYYYHFVLLSFLDTSTITTTTVFFFFPPLSLHVFSFSFSHAPPGRFDPSLTSCPPPSHVHHFIIVSHISSSSFFLSSAQTMFPLLPFLFPSHTTSLPSSFLSSLQPPPTPPQLFFILSFILLIPFPRLSFPFFMPTTSHFTPTPFFPSSSI